MTRQYLAAAALAAVAFLSATTNAQTIGCEVGVANGGLFPTTGTGGGGTYPTTLPTVTTSFTLNVATLPPGATVVTEVKLFGLSHTFVGDVQFVLTDPSGANHNLFVRGSTPTGTSFGCDFSGDYVIVPACTQATLALPATCTGTGVFLPAGAYDQQFGRGTLAWPNGTNGIFNTPLSAIPAATGAWTLNIYDWAGGDSGTLASFDVCFGTPPAPSAPGTAPVLSTPTNGSSFFNAGSVNLAWGSVDCATSYEIDVDGVVTAVLSSPFSFASTPGLHTWAVRGLNTTGAGPWSAPFTFTDLGPPPAAFSPALIVGNDQSPATIYAIDPSNGAALPLYTGTGIDAKPWGLAYDPATNTLYWNNGSTLFSSPYANPLVPTNLGAITFNSVAITCVSLSFSNGKLYATRNITTEAVYEIDPATLVATQVYVYPTAFDFGGLEHDLTNGKLYGLTDSAGAPLVRGLYELDVVADTATFLAPYPAGETDIDGLAVHNGLAYYVSDGPNTTQANFYVFDVATGLQVGTIPSPFTGSGTFSAATFVDGGTPGPVTYCTAGVSTNGCSATMSASSGTASIAAGPGSFVLTASGVEGQKLGLMFYGINGQAAATWGTSSSFLCVKAPTQRLPSVNTNGTAGLCDGALTMDFFGYMAANPFTLGQPITAGQVYNAQAWYRDPPSPKTTHLSNGIEFTLAP